MEQIVAGVYIAQWISLKEASKSLLLRTNNSENQKPLNSESANLSLILRHSGIHAYIECSEYW